MSNNYIFQFSAVVNIEYNLKIKQAIKLLGGTYDDSRVSLVFFLLVLFVTAID